MTRHAQDATFFDGDRRLNRTALHLDSLPELPASHVPPPDLRGRHVLDLERDHTRCSREAPDHGASSATHPAAGYHHTAD